MYGIEEIEGVEFDVLFGELMELIVSGYTNRLRLARPAQLLRQGLKESYGEAFAALEPLRVMIPTQFVWSLADGLIGTAEDIKTYLAAKVVDYDIEADKIATRSEVEAFVGKWYPLETPFWKLFSEKRYEEAALLLPAIEENRKDMNPQFRIEVYSWRKDIAVYTGNEKEFLAVMTTIFTLFEDDGVQVEATKFTEAVYVLFQHKFKKGFIFEPTRKGTDAIASSSIADFRKARTEEFLMFLAWHVAHEICETRSVFSTETLASFLENNWKQLVGGFVENCSGLLENVYLNEKDDDSY